MAGCSIEFSDFPYSIRDTVACTMWADQNPNDH